MTDGEPDEFQDVIGLASRIKVDTENKRYQFIPIAVEGANMDVLNQISGSIPPMKLKEARFSSFFQWLSSSIGTVINSEKDEDLLGWIDIM